MQPLSIDNRGTLRRYALLSMGVAVATMALKAGAYRVTGSIGLFSDALESLVNLGAAGLAYLSLSIAARPPDDSHAFGHDKIEFFAAGLEGALILLAALTIGWAAVGRFINPVVLESIGAGSVLALVATGLNLYVGRTLTRAGRLHDSPTLEADGAHLLTDVWSTGAVLAGVVLARLTGWVVLDPLMALLMAAVIVRTGIRLLRRSVGGLMDEALPESELARLRAILDGYRRGGLEYHALRTRRSGARRFASVHLLVPGVWTVAEGHALCEQVEADLRAALPALSVLTHLEPLGDPTALRDIPLDRPVED